MSIDPEGSVTQWIADLQVGEAQDAEHDLWDRYFRRLVALARMKLGDAPRGAEDEEDVAVSALRSFYSGLAAGRFPQLGDRHNLWALLAKITACKAINQRHRQLAKKRGGGRVLSEGQIAQPSSMNERQLAEFVEDGLTPDFIVAVNEQCQELMARLADHFQLATDDLQNRRQDLESVRQELAEQNVRLQEQRSGLQHWLERREKDIEERAARLVSRETELDAQQREFDKASLRWQADHSALQQQIQTLLAEQREKANLAEQTAA